MLVFHREGKADAISGSKLAGPIASNSRFLDFVLSNKKEA